jgi:hypothetical protein
MKDISSLKRLQESLSPLRTALKARITLWNGVADRIAVARKPGAKWSFIQPTATGLAGGRRAVSLSKTSAGV